MRFVGGRGRAIAFVTLASSAFAVSSPIARFARPAHPLFVAFGRVALASLVLFALDMPGVWRHWRNMNAATRWRIIICGVLLGTHFGLFQAGLDATSLPAAVSLVSLEPVGVVFAAFIFFREVPSRREQIGVVLATMGAAVIAFAAGTGEHKLVGDLLVLGSVALFGFYVAAARAIRNALPPQHAGSMIYAVAALVILLVLPYAGTFDNVTNLPQRSFLAIAGIALIPTIIGHTSVQAAARTLPPAIVSLVSPGETLGSLLIAATFLHDIPKPQECVGAALILSGVLFAIFGPTSNTPNVSNAQGP
jgi:drug/metabolite transporter (DMT)-like permease